MKPGTLIAGRYRLDEAIASGGMGTVWRAVDVNLDRSVAVKILHAGQDRERSADRFRREAKILASLKGPGFVQIHDYGRDEDTQFIVMELVEGGSLRDEMDAGPLSPDRTLEVCASVAEALDTAHSQGVVHRDVKPSNILEDDRGHVRVVDFGISFLAGRTRVTDTGTVLGTLSYIAPEQLEDMNTTAAADVYALGAVAYECLSGAPPFESRDPSRIIEGHLRRDPAPLPESVPSAVGDLVLLALAKDPADRPSAAEFTEQCRELLSERGMGVPADAAASEDEDKTVQVGTPDQTVHVGPPDATVPVGSRPIPARDGGTSADRPEVIEEKPRRTGPLIVTAVAVIAILAIAAPLSWQLWRDSGDTAAPPGTAASSSEEDGAIDSGEDGEDTAEDDASADASDEPDSPDSSEGDDTGSDDSGDNQGSNDSTDGGSESGNDGGQDSGGDGGNDGGGDSGGGGGDGDNGGDGGSEPDPDRGKLPNVVGMTTHQAKSTLSSAGFTNVGGTYTFGGGTHCEVISQNPDGGQTRDYDEAIVLTYALARNDDCELS
ncbi:serine/threonine-protein kinase [Salininema proteolyticum]|uniref:Serine/threonine-protein kinase n=1 Tax=Salininema proteolyticum TaxID=1607685 RepID=A0ABV8U0T7_9ACTN